MQHRRRGPLPQDRLWQIDDLATERLCFGPCRPEVAPKPKYGGYVGGEIGATVLNRFAVVVSRCVEFRHPHLPAPPQTHDLVFTQACVHLEYVLEDAHVRGGGNSGFVVNEVDRGCANRALDRRPKSCERAGISAAPTCWAIWRADSARSISTRSTAVSFSTSSTSCRSSSRSGWGPLTSGVRTSTIGLPALM
jgi:hypothetical protein